MRQQENEPTSASVQKPSRIRKKYVVIASGAMTVLVVAAFVVYFLTRPQISYRVQAPSTADKTELKSKLDAFTQQQTDIAKQDAESQYGYYLRKSELLTGTGDYAQALVAIKAAADTGYTLDSRYYLDRGQVYDLQNEKDKAKADYMSAKEKLSITPKEYQVSAQVLDDMIGSL